MIRLSEVIISRKEGEKDNILLQRIKRERERREKERNKTERIVDEIVLVFKKQKRCMDERKEGE